MPTPKQLEDMDVCRSLFKEFINKIDSYIPDGPDKTYVMRQLRDSAMWVNISITRNADGSPRT